MHRHRVVRGIAAAAELGLGFRVRVAEKQKYVIQFVSTDLLADFELADFIIIIFLGLFS